MISIRAARSTFKVTLEKLPVLHISQYQPQFKYTAESMSGSLERS